MYNGWHESFRKCLNERYVYQLYWNICCISVCTDGGTIAGAIIGAIVFFCSIAGLLYYVFSVRGYKLSSLSLPTRTTSNIDVVSYRFACYSWTRRHGYIFMGVNAKLRHLSVAACFQQPQLWRRIRHIKHCSGFVQYIECDALKKNQISDKVVWQSR